MSPRYESWPVGGRIGRHRLLIDNVIAKGKGTLKRQEAGEKYLTEPWIGLRSVRRGANVPGQQVGDTSDRMIRDAIKHVLRIGPGIETIELRGFDQAADSGLLAASMRAISAGVSLISGACTISAS